MSVDVAMMKAGHPNKCVPETSYESEVAPKLEEIYSSLGISADALAQASFDPEKHLRYYNDEMEKHRYHNTRTLTMEELGLTNKKQISSIGVSDPFPLFTDEAIAIMKAEILQKDIFMKYARRNHSSTSGMDCIIRGYVKTGEEIHTPFVHLAWTHPKTLELISHIAGVELEVVMDYEIAHVNMAMEDKSAVDGDKSIREAQARARQGLSDGSDIPAIVGWHNDSYPFVCVLMLSDTTDMIGGETSLRMGGADDGTPKKVCSVPGPQLGFASVLQGRLIEHIAPKPVGVTERITMVTSYRAKDPLKHEGSVLATVKPEINSGTRYNDFYPEWINYRLDILEKRFAHLRATMSDSDGNFNKELSMDYLKQLDSYLKDTYEYMEVSDRDIKKLKKIQGIVE